MTVKKPEFTQIRVLVTISFPALALMAYWPRWYRDSQSMDQLFLVIAIGVLVAAGMYMYFPLAKKVKLLSFTWGIDLRCLSWPMHLCYSICIPRGALEFLSVLNRMFFSGISRRLQIPGETVHRASLHLDAID